MVKHPPTHPLADEGIVVHEPLALGGVRFHHLRGVAVGIDEAGQPVRKIDVGKLDAKQKRLLKRLLAETLAELERGGARLH